MMHEGPKTSQFRRRIVLVLLVLYTAFVLVITMTPRMPGSGTVGRVVYRFLNSVHARGLFLDVGYLHIEFLGNILMFVPLGVLLALLVSRRHWWVLLFAGTAFSAVIELTQYLFLPSRVPEVRDLASNTTGFLLGAIASVLLRLLISHRDSLVEHDRKEAARNDHERRAAN